MICSILDSMHSLNLDPSLVCKCPWAGVGVVDPSSQPCCLQIGCEWFYRCGTFLQHGAILLCLSKGIIFYTPLDCTYTVLLREPCLSLMFMLIFILNNKKKYISFLSQGKKTTLCGDITVLYTEPHRPHIQTSIVNAL